MQSTQILVPTGFNPAPVLVLVNIPLELETASSCTGVAKLVPVPFSQTGYRIEDVHSFTNKGAQIRLDLIARRRRFVAYVKECQVKVIFEDQGPLVLIIGIGQSGFAVAARLAVKLQARTKEWETTGESAMTLFFSMILLVRI